MTAHELARRLLAGPDDPVVIAEDDDDRFIENVRSETVVEAENGTICRLNARTVTSGKTLYVIRIW